MPPLIVLARGPQHPPLVYNLAGILVIGGYYSPYTVEFWSSTNADQESCQLSDYPREMDFPTVSIVENNKLIACFSTSCDIYHEGAWEHLQDTIHERRWHSAVAMQGKVQTPDAFFKCFFLEGGARGATQDVKFFDVRNCMRTC